MQTDSRFIRGAAALALGCALAHLVLGLLVLQPAPFAGGDNATYLSLARSLLERGDYTRTWDPALPPETLYPPLLPVLLAGALAVGVPVWTGLKVLMVLVSAVAVGFSVLWVDRVASRRVAAWVGAVLAVSPGVLELSHPVLSEPLFWALTMVALWAWTHVEPDDAAELRTGWLVGSAAAVAAAWLTRSLGVALAVAILLRLAGRRRWRAAALFGVVAVGPAALMWLRGRLVGGVEYGDYLLLADPYRPEEGRIGPLGLVPRALHNGGRYLTDLGPDLLLGQGSLATTLGTALFIVALAGWATRLVRRRGAVPELWLPAYAALVLIWPETWAGTRFVLAIAPAVLLCAVEPWRLLPTRARVATGSIACALVTVAVVPPLSRQFAFAAECRAIARAGQPYECMGQPWADIMTVAANVRGRLGDDAVVLNRKPTLFFANSGYRGTLYPETQDPTRFFAFVDSVGAGWVVLDDAPDLAAHYLEPILSAVPDRFCVVEASSLAHAVLLRIEPPGAAPRSQDVAGLTRFRGCTLDGP